MSTVIAFSGGCYSGKTTTIGIVKKALENAGYEVVTLNELIRVATSQPIDELRKNPSEYLKLQEKIIKEKIEQENKAFEDKSDKVYLIDRAITDSLFYLQNYVDKSALTEEEMIRYCKLHKAVISHAKKAFSQQFGYNVVLEFVPIKEVCVNDKYRPKHITYSKEYEHDAISILNFNFMHRNAISSVILRIDLNVDTVYKIVNFIQSIL